MNQNTMIVNDGGKWFIVPNDNSPFTFGDSKVSVVVKSETGGVRWYGYGLDGFEALDDLAICFNMLQRIGK